ncbi:putative DNA-binding pseudobarrel domain superfamily [Helianthus anomalus]
MMYGFACYMDDNRRKCLVLPKKHKQSVKEFNYPVSFVKVRTTNGQVFEVQVYELGSVFYFYNGWYSVVETLKLQSRSLFYYRPNGAFDKPDAMHINRLFVHHKMDNTIPNYPVLIRGPRSISSLFEWM